MLAEQHLQRTRAATLGTWNSPTPTRTLSWGLRAEVWSTKSISFSARVIYIKNYPSPRSKSSKFTELREEQRTTSYQLRCGSFCLKGVFYPIVLLFVFVWWRDILRLRRRQRYKKIEHCSFFSWPPSTSQLHSISSSSYPIIHLWSV